MFGTWRSRLTRFCAALCSYMPFNQERSVTSLLRKGGKNLENDELYPAQQCFERALTLATAAGNKELQARAHQGLAKVALERGNDEQALGMLKHARELVFHLNWDDPLCEEIYAEYESLNESIAGQKVGRMLRTASMASTVCGVAEDGCLDTEPVIWRKLEEALAYVHEAVGPRHWLEAAVLSSMAYWRRVDGHAYQALELMRNAKEIALEFPERAPGLAEDIARDLSKWESEW